MHCMQVPSGFSSKSRSGRELRIERLRASLFLSAAVRCSIRSSNSSLSCFRAISDSLRVVTSRPTD